MELVYDANQLSVGQDISSKITIFLDDYYQSVEEQFTKIIRNSYECKVDLSDTLSVDGFKGIFDDINRYLEDSDKLACKQASLIDQYNRGDFNSYTTSAASILKSEIYANSNLVNPDASTKVFATVGMGAFKFGEGFVGFFEDLGDAVLTAGSFVSRFAGNKELSDNLNNIVQIDVSKNIFENNAAFQWINDNSYFDKDSKYANGCKFLGKLAGAYVTGRGVSKLYSTFNKEKAAEELAASAAKVSSRTTKGLDIVRNEEIIVRNQMKNGSGFRSSLINGTVVTAATFGLTKFVSAPASKAIGEKIASTGLGTVVSVVDNKIDETFSTGAKNIMGKTANIFAKTVVNDIKNQTTDLVSNDGNIKTKDDQVVETVSKTGIDLVYKTGVEIIN